MPNVCYVDGNFVPPYVFQQHINLVIYQERLLYVVC